MIIYTALSRMLMVFLSHTHVLHISRQKFYHLDQGVYKAVYWINILKTCVMIVFTINVVVLFKDHWYIRVSAITTQNLCVCNTLQMPLFLKLSSSILAYTYTQLIYLNHMVKEIKFTTYYIYFWMKDIHYLRKILKTIGMKP